MTGRRRSFLEQVALAAVALATVWISFLLDPTLILFTAALLAAEAWAVFGRRWLVVAAVVLLNPLFTTFAVPWVDHARGEARLLGYGLPGVESWNLDESLRVQRTGAGCRADARRELVTSIHNWGLRAATASFGPQRGAYIGPYPDRQTALAAVLAGEDVAPDQLADGVLPLADRTVTLEPGVGRGILTVYWQDFPIWEDQRQQPHRRPLVEAITLRATVVDWPCVAVFIPDTAYARPRPAPEPAGVVVLLNGEDGRPFACYAYGSPMASAPPSFFYWPEQYIQ